MEEGGQKVRGGEEKGKRGEKKRGQRDREGKLGEREDWKGKRGRRERGEGEEIRERTKKPHWRNLGPRVHCVKDTEFIVALW